MVARYENFTLLNSVISESQSGFYRLFRGKKLYITSGNSCDFRWLLDIEILTFWIVISKSQSSCLDVKTHIISCNS